MNAFARLFRAAFNLFMPDVKRGYEGSFVFPAFLLIPGHTPPNTGIDQLSVPPLFTISKNAVIAGCSFFLYRQIILDGYHP
ncbi:MAG TPA: hypothetical protein ENI76_07995 [Ignavibacteria bacterium]|nr:hypothetical protein [Ignavibacteria bacterium]